MRFHTSDSTASNITTQDYNKRKVSIDNLINEFQQLYTTICFKRSTPNNMILPNSFLKLLLGVNYLCKGKKKNPAAHATEILGYVRKAEGGNMKTSNSIWYDLCRMTADPFPLVVSEKDKEETGHFISTPLYSLSDGFPSAERYSKVGLSKLGEIACGEYYAARKTNSIKQLKTIVPLALLRKIMPWSLGHQSMSLGYNPSELFKLQAKMIEHYGENPTDPTPWLLPDEDVQSIFRGIDVGDNYEGYMKNKSLMSLYHLGRGSVTIVPKITINRDEKCIIIEAPPINSISVNTADYINCRIIGEDALTGKAYPKFETFQPKITAVVVNLQIVMDEVEFKGSNQEILDELQADDYIRVTAAITNTVMVDTKTNRNEELDQKLRDSDIQDSALDDYLVDVMPIHELLWRHVVWEYEKRLDIYKDKLRQAEKDMEVDIFLEKVTRKEVVPYIYPIIKLKRSQKKAELIKLFQSENRDKSILPEGFCDWEISEICLENTKNGRTGLNILNILNERDSYKNRWKATEARINELKAIIESPGRIYSEIKADLDVWSEEPEFQRKTKMYFVDTVEISKREIRYDFNYSPETYDKSYLPCTLYYSRNRVVRNYGRNINFVPQRKEDVEVHFEQALNTTNWDKVYLITNQKIELFDVMSFPCYPITKNGILGIIPYSEDSDIMVILQNDAVRDAGAKCSQYFIIPAGGIKERISFPINTSIRTWCYLNKKYVEILSFNMKLKRFLYGLLLTEEIPRNTYKPDLLPIHIGAPLDIHETGQVGGATGAWATMDYTPLAAKSVPILSWDSKKSKTYTVLSNLDYQPYFSQHVEIYAGRTYMSDWKAIGAAHVESFTHGKKSVIDELIWCRPDDPVSKHLNHLIEENLPTLKPTLHAVFSHDAESYTSYSIAQLDDWSLINPRYKLPIKRPDIEEALITYDNYMDEMFTCKISESSFKKIVKELKTAKNLVLAHTDMNPFSYNDDIHIPKGLDIETLDMNDDSDPYDENEDIDE